MSANKNVEKITDVRFEHLPDEKGDLDDYWLAWIGDLQSDGQSQYEALNNVVTNYEVVLQEPEPFARLNPDMIVAGSTN